MSKERLLNDCLMNDCLLNDHLFAKFFEMTYVFYISARGLVTNLLRYVFSPNFLLQKSPNLVVDNDYGVAQLSLVWLENKNIQA